MYYDLNYNLRYKNVLNLQWKTINTKIHNILKKSVIPFIGITAVVNIMMCLSRCS